jgi:hypothetical protein
MEDLVSYMVRGIVSQPELVQVREGERRGEPALKVDVADADRGVVIGREGRTIRAMETLMRAADPSGHPPALDIGS